ncbi:MAG: HEPN domain-containing protein [Candidatus Hydrogenedentota bacterium]
MSEKIVKNWMIIAEYDLKTAKHMYKSRRYLYVAFTCQQAIEKILKAIYVKENNKTPPYTHNLIKLINLTSIASMIKESELTFVELLNSYYLESRYTETIKELFKSLTKKRSFEILRKTRSLFKWLKRKI